MIRKYSVTIPDAVLLCAPLVRKHEGLRLKAYLCPAGVPTLGYGSTGPDIKLGMTCTKEWAEGRMLQDLTAYYTQMIRACPVLLECSPERQAAVLDWVYNLGLGRFKASTLLRKIKARDWDSVPAEILKWVYGGGKKLPGLVIRRGEEARMWAA